MRLATYFVFIQHWATVSIHGERLHGMAFGAYALFFFTKNIAFIIVTENNMCRLM